MKRFILAVAMSVAALVANAQSNVTIYGVADAAYMYSRGGDASFSGIESGAWTGSRFGVKGEEGLGNGLKAIFALEYGTDIDNGTGLTKARQSYVGLDSLYGAVTVGRQYAPSGILMLRNSAFEVSGATSLNQFAGSSNSGIAQIGGSMGTGDQSRWNNSVAYQSKVYSGFSGRAIYSFGESGTNTDIRGANNSIASPNDNSRFGLGGSYENGPLNVDVIYQGTHGVTTSYLPVDGRQGGNINEYYLGAGYDFRVVKIVGSYQQLNSSNDAYDGIGAKVASIGAIYPVSQRGKIRAEYSKIKFDQGATAQPDATLQTDGNSTGWSLGYTHDLSKRTMLYTSYTHINNSRQSLALGANNVGALDESNYAIVSGLKHSF